MATYDGQPVKGHNGTVQFDGTFVTITRKGGLARVSVGKGEKRIPVSAISAVQWKEPGALVNGFIQFTVAGGVERRSRAGSQTRDAVSDENSVIIRKSQALAFRELKEAIEAGMAQGATPIPATADPMAQLRKLSELRDAGLISSEEFDAKRTEILGRM